jgi:hypothetical protein
VLPVGDVIWDIRSIAFADENNGWVVANNGRIYRTTDGGDHWAMESDINGNSLFGIRFADPKRGWAVGTGGAILHFNNTPVSVAADRRVEFPQRFALKQNYPNPFNPSTTIKFELLKASQVSLAVYDILGREVSVLMNERRDAGVHEVKFDGSNLAGGVYFYRLSAGTYVQTRKLILLH